MTTSQNVTAPKLLGHVTYLFPGLTTSQNVTAPKLGDDGIDRLQEKSDILYASMTEAELRASDKYTTDEKGFINSLLFGNMKEGSSWSEDEIRRFVADIRESMNQFELDIDVTVFKGVPARYYDDWIPGETRTFSGFLSTSLDPAIAQRYYSDNLEDAKDALMFEIRVPRGTMSMYVGDNTNAKSGNEFELLVANGAKLRILERSGDRMVMEVVGFE